MAHLIQKKLVVIQKDDYKSLKWAEAARGSGIELLPQPGTPIKAPLFLVKTSLHRGVPAGYVVRYLNDYPSLPKSLLRLMSEIALVVLCVLLRVKLFWICHNLDKETACHHPRISRLRRWMFASMAKRVFVTDPLLMPHAKQYFPAYVHKMDAISFGSVESSGRGDRDAEQIAIAFIQHKRAEAEAEKLKPLVLFCAGAPAEKSLHFDFMENLIFASQKADFKIIAIVAGDFLSSLRGKRLLERYRSNHDICVFERYTHFSNEFVCNHVDFYWRGYGDWSVPFTVYEAATLRKPLLALKSGFLPEIVEDSGIGCVVSAKALKAGISLGCLYSVSHDSYEFFLAKRQWCVLPQKLKEFYFEVH